MRWDYWDSGYYEVGAASPDSSAERKRELFEEKLESNLNAYERRKQFWTWAMVFVCLLTWYLAFESDPRSYYIAILMYIFAWAYADSQYIEKLGRASQLAHIHIDNSDDEDARASRHARAHRDYRRKVDDKRASKRFRLAGILLTYALASYFYFTFYIPNFYGFYLIAILMNIAAYFRSKYNNYFEIELFYYEKAVDSLESRKLAKTNK